jgi:hypothetical protein
MRCCHRGAYTTVCLLNPPLARSCMIRIPLHRTRLDFRSYIHNLPKGLTRISDATATSPTLGQASQPERGGQNLSARFARLERSLRGKGGLAQTIENTPLETSFVSNAGELPKVKLSEPKAELFHGLLVPEIPKEPGPDGMTS